MRLEQTPGALSDCFLSPSVVFPSPPGLTISVSWIGKRDNTRYKKLRSGSMGTWTPLDTHGTVAPA
jgi:hypothetical protein